jgi:hypothetical protein
MSKGKSDKITYKPYEQKQAYLIPPSVDELIPENHLVRLVNETIDEMGIQRLLEQQRAGGGASRYHPAPGNDDEIIRVRIHEQGMFEPDAG